MPVYQSENSFQPELWNVRFSCKKGNIYFRVEQEKADESLHILLCLSSEWFPGGFLKNFA